MPRLLLLLLIPVLLFPGAIPGPRVVSADDHLTVHHAFQDQPGGHVRHPQLSDPALQFKALRRRVVSALRAGRAPLWNPDLYAGAPLLADGQSMVGSPVTWLHALLPEDAAQDAGVWWVLVWGGLGAALLVRKLGGDGLIAGAATMTGPYLSVWLLHPHAATFCWLPWVFLGLESRAWITALAVAGLLAGGHPGTAVFGLALGAAWWLVRTRDLRGVIGVLIGALLAAPLWLPLAEQAARSTTLAARGGLTLSPAQLLDLVWPGWWGHPADGSWRGSGSWADGQLHPGLGALGLALLSLRDRRARWLMAAWLACLLLAWVGLPGPFAPSRLGAMGTVFVALAAGLVAGGRAGWSPGWRRLWRWLGPLLVFGTGMWARHLDQGTLPAEAHDPPPAEWTTSLRQAVGDGRVLGLGWALQPNTGALVGLRDLRGYDLPVSADTQRLMAALNPRPQAPWYPVDAVPSEHLLRFADVRMVLSTTPLDRQPYPLSDAPLYAYPVSDAWRAWMAPSATALTSAQDAARRIAAADLRAIPPVAGPSIQGQGPIIPLDVVEDSPELVRVTPQGVGLLVLADAWAPGWTAQVDGVDAPVLRVGGLFRGVMLREPAKQVVFRYRPAGWTWGLRLGLLGLIGLALAVRRR